MKRTLLKAIFLAAGVAPAIFGSTITYTSTFAETATDFSGTLPIKQFDPALGNLSLLTITLTGDVQGSATITNLNATARTYNITLENQVTLVDPLLDVLVAILPTFANTVIVPGNTTMSFSGSGGATQTNSYNDAATLAEFTGTGNFATTINASGLNGFTGPSNSTFVAGTTAGGSATIVYTYSPSRVTSTPEPLTTCLVGCGLIALGFLKPRNKRD